MSWVKHDDGFSGSNKVFPLSDKAYRLHFCGLEHCARNLTDGVIAAEFLPVIAATAKCRTPNRYVAELVTAGLWLVVPGGWEVKDYLEFNPTAEQVKERRAKEREKKRRQGKNGADSRWDSPGGSPGEDAGGTPLGSTPWPSDGPVPLSTTEVGAKDTPTSATALVKPRQPDPVWDTLTAVYGPVANDVERGKRNKAAKLLKQAAASPDEIRRRAAVYRATWPDVAFTEMALAANWSKLDGPASEEERLRRHFEKLDAEGKTL